MCANCIGNHYRSDQFECEECPSDSSNFISFILYVSGLICILILLVRMTMNGSQLRKPLYSVYVKIFFNHYQLLQVISTI